jgi:hypothetical protein
VAADPCGISGDDDMRIIINYLLIAVSLLDISCIPNLSADKSVMVCEGASKNDTSSNMSLSEIRSVCNRLANFRDQLDGIEDPRVTNELLLSSSVGGYGYEDLLYIVRRYGSDIGIDGIYEKCAKYLYLFNDGEYAGAIDEVMPDLKLKFAGRSQEWLLDS